MGKPFVQEVDASEVEKKVKNYLIAINDVKTTFPKGTKDEVLDTLGLRVREVNGMMDLILALGNKSLKPKHWKSIFELVDKEDSSLQNCTLKEFKDMGMQEHKEEIEEISSIATGES